MVKHPLGFSHIVPPDTFSIKYRRSNREWANLPFQANGGGMAIYATVVTTLVSTKSLTPNLVLIIPCVVFFCGLVFAYVTHAINFTMDGDLEQKERLSDAMEFIIANEEKVGSVPDLKTQFDTLVAFVAAEREKLLTAPRIQKMQVTAAYC